jgi:hypothetical protein
MSRVPQGRQSRPRSTRTSTPVRINPLIHPYPKHPRHPGQHRRQRQEQHNSPHRALHDGPPKHFPHQRREHRNRPNSQPIPDIHRPQEVPLLSLKLQPASWTPLVHSRKEPDGSSKDIPHAAPWTQRMKDSAHRRRVTPNHGRECNKPESSREAAKECSVLAP